jgi:hypothetical protein
MASTCKYTGCEEPCAPKKRGPGSSIHCEYHRNYFVEKNKINTKKKKAKLARDMQEYREQQAAILPTYRQWKRKRHTRLVCMCVLHWRKMVRINKLTEMFLRLKNPFCYDMYLQMGYHPREMLNKFRVFSSKKHQKSIEEMERACGLSPNSD